LSKYLPLGLIYEYLIDVIVKPLWIFINLVWSTDISSPRKSLHEGNEFSDIVSKIFISSLDIEPPRANPASE
jgi:hypothetical protein